MRLRHHRATLLSLLLLVALPLVHGAGAHAIHLPGPETSVEAPADGDVAVVAVDEGCTLCAASRGSFARLAGANAETLPIAHAEPVAARAEHHPAQHGRILADAPRAPPESSPRHA